MEIEDQTENELVALKNGETVPRCMVEPVMVAIKYLVMRGDLPTLIELVRFCRNPEHKLYGDCDQVLLDLSLIEKDQTGFRVHDTIRNIVLSMAHGSGLDMQFCSPIAA